MNDDIDRPANSHPAGGDPAGDPAAHRGLAQHGQACRQYLRSAFAAGEPSDAAHRESCSFCAQRMMSAQALAGLLAQRPASPPGLASRSMLERVEASVVRQAEESRLGQVLAASMPVDVAAAATEVSVAEAVVAVPPGLLESSLAEQLRSTSVRVSPASWRTVQASIYGQVLADSTSRRRYWPLAAAGAAAAAILLLVLLSEGTSKPPEIVFADLATMPNVDFAILRYGAR